jgi:anti-sigma-K factor RskA
MTREPRIGPDGRDDDLTRALRGLFAAPADQAYWDALAARIMARIDRQEETWWSPYSGWVREGVLVAAVAMLVIAAGLAWVRNAEDAPVAYDAVIETPRTLSQQLATETTGLPASEATLRFVIDP